MIIGQLDTRITIQQATTTKDGRGQAVTTYTNWCEVWAKVDETSATETDSANRQQGVRNYTVTIRHRDGLTMKNRLLYNSNPMEITSITNQGRKQYIEISAVKREK